MSGRGTEVRTVVAVLTYRRAGSLPDLLSALADQADAIAPRADVLVIDNDPAAGAADVVARWAGRGVRYVHEPRPGISAARNRALAEAGSADLLAFIDDDELPSPGWLATLVAAWREWDCAAVVGPVPAHLMAPADSWVAGSGMFDRQRYDSGQRMPGAGAGNLLLDLRRVHAHGIRFDERFGLTGGEDTLFTRELVRAGEEIRWCDEAEAVEFVPADRLTRRWVLTRSFRSGSSYSRAEVHLAGGSVGRVRLRVVSTGKAAVRGSLAAVQWLAAAARRDVAGRARALCTFAAYAGLVAGAFGHVHAEYARVPDAGPVPPAGELRHVVPT